MSLCGPGRFCAATLIAVGCVLLFLAACQKTPVSGGLAKLNQCSLEGINEKLLCGKLTVFENRERRTGRKIDLNIVVLPALDQKTKREPLFHLEGGPGIDATGVAGFYATDGKECRRHRDVVLVDQRGTGQSNPLTVPEKKAPQDYLREMYPVDYVKNMRQTLEQRADLTQYTTSIAMDDLDDVRAWLGYDRINLFGLSYGTRAALVYLRLHPEHVHTVTLMGVAPTYLRMPMYHSQAAARAMDLLLQECERDAQCHQAFPQIRDDWTNVLAQLERAPARVEYSPQDKSAADDGRDSARHFRRENPKLDIQPRQQRIGSRSSFIRLRMEIGRRFCATPSLLRFQISSQTGCICRSPARKTSHSSTRRKRRG